MLLLCLRLLPWIAAACSAWLMQWQWRDPLLFPWPIIGVAAMYLLSSIALSWQRSTWREWLGRTMPTLITLLGSVLAAAIFEGSARTGLSAFVTILVFTSLELLFFLLFNRSRYPVNGFTHLHLGLVPTSAALFAWGVVGWWMFARTGPFEHYLPEMFAVVLLFSLLGGGFFYLTSHPDATTRERSTWTLFGAFIGFCIAWFLFILPIPLEAHALLAALLIALPLRLRRYKYAPTPSSRTAWVESGLALSILTGVLLLSRWA